MNDPLQLVGTTIAEKYRVDAVVGEGGFAIVYKATHLFWKRPVAIKVFRALGDFGEERRAQLVEAFVQEGALLAALSERNAAIVQARDIGTMTTADGHWMPYMVLEWLEGRTLEAQLDDERARGAPLRTADQAIALLEPAIEALAMAHEKGIAHRDVKPGNVFILGDAWRTSVHVKLLDFGIAKVVSDAQKETGAFRQTGGQITSFTPAYGAPEQFSRTYGATGPWTDVYAIALVLTEVLAGCAPLLGDSLPELAFASCDKARRPTPRALGVDVPDALEAVLQRALAVSPDERFQSAGELWAALRGAGRTTGYSQTSPVAVRVTPPVAPASYGAPPGPTAATALAPQIPPSAPRFGPATMDPSSRTSKGAPSGGGAALAFAIGGVALAALGAAGFFVVTRRATAKPVASAVVPPASVAPAPPPAPACPAGMLPIPGGKFFMGSDDRRDLASERPAHQVSLAPYCMDELEVTVLAYQACSDKGECKRAGRENDWDGITAKEHATYDPLCNARDAETKAKHPINCVDWDMARRFCEWQGRRLPTEAEWEFAARGPDGRKYPWGDEPPAAGHLNACGKECLAWAKKNGVHDLTSMYDADDGWPNTAPVGSFSAGKSRYGVQDVVGNVWEWTADWYAPYTADAQDDPRGPAAGDDGRVIRGGAWNGGDPSWVRPTFRYHDAPTKRSYGIGFRCAKSLP